MFTYIYNDQPVAPDEATKYPTMVAGPEFTGELEVVRVFQSNDDFSKWAERTAHGDKVHEILRLLRIEVLPERKNEAWIEQMQRLALNRARENFAEFAKLLNRSPFDEEVIRKAMVERTPLTPKMFDPIFLYDREIEHEPPAGPPEDPLTSSFIVPSGWWPDLGFVGWNDRARSVRLFGVNVLCEHNWFGGRWCWLSGFNGFINLNHLGFDQITSSVIAN
jgi:hypothetical protein